ncbi:MAG: hypothetical protein JWR27_649 [Aeromicrobium sp.]|nr:hypothetical protein [Aeromicrobium sp.]MCW2789274.1 hypothetical protein [Aeromicrobium sp.]
MAKKSDHRRKLEAEAASKPDTKSPGRGTWRLMDRGSALAAGLLAQRASAITWRVVTGKKPPTSGRHPDVGTREAVAWAVVGGAIIELVKVGVRRGTATYWVKSTGKLPPGMKPLKASGKTKEPVPEEPAPSHTSTKKVSRRSRGR